MVMAPKSKGDEGLAGGLSRAKALVLSYGLLTVSGGQNQRPTELLMFVILWQKGVTVNPFATFLHHPRNLFCASRATWPSSVEPCQGSHRRPHAERSRRRAPNGRGWQRSGP